MSRRATPAISVIVPVYNVEAYVAECLDSLLAQSHDDFEVIIVDDGSTDASGAIAQRYVSAHPDCFTYYAKPNGGLGDARNFGIARAAGEYLAFVDSDDTVDPEFLARLHARARETGAELVICGIQSFSAAGPLPYIPEPDLTVFGHSLAEEPRLLFRVDASVCDKLFARAALARAGVEFPVGTAFEDVPFTYRVVAHANRIEKVDEPLYRYRQHRPDSITGVSADNFLDLVRSFAAVDEFYAAREDGAKLRGPLLRLNLVHLIAGRLPDFLLNASAPDRSHFLSAVFDLLDARFSGWRTGPEPRALWRNAALRAVCTHRSALTAFCRLPRRAYLGILARTGAFDPLR